MSRKDKRMAQRDLNLTQEALLLVRSGREAGLQLRMLGSTAVIAKCGAARDLLLRHGVDPKDIDLAALGHQRRRVRDFVHGRGLVSPGSGLVTPYMDRDVFVGGSRQMRVEVFYDELRFVHRISFVGDFGRSFPSLPLDTLLMSKLQMRKRSFNDWLHLAALLMQVASEEVQEDGSMFSQRITRQVECDFRCWRDFQAGLEELGSSERLGALSLTSDEKTALEVGTHRVNLAIAAARHGPKWFFGKVKAGLRIEPPEPEVAEYWQAG